MTPTDWAVIVAGTAIIGLINWYFFLARPAVVAAAPSGDRQGVSIVVDGGYEPRHVRVRAGVPVRLLFDRRDTSPCSEEVVLPDFGVKRFLPPHRTTAVDFVPAVPGTFSFTCGMGMLRGQITVDPAGAVQS